MNIKQEILRKLVHLSSLWICFLSVTLERELFIIILSIITMLFMICDFYKKKITFVSIILVRFKNILRNHEKRKGFTGASYFLLGAWMCYVLFDSTVANISVLLLIFADSSAAIIGKRFGRVNILNKTLEGSVSFFIVGVLICIIFYTQNFIGLNIMLYAVIAVLISTFVELFSSKINIDDNFTIPLSFAFSITMIQSVME